MKATNNQFILETYHKYRRFIYLFSQTVINKHRPNLIEEHKEIVSELAKGNVQMLLIYFKII